MRWFVALAVLLLAGCSSGGGVDEPASGRPTAAALPTAAGTHRLRLDDREYLLHVPPGARGRLPLVLAMHGGLSDMTRMERLTGLDAVADREGFLVAYPNGFLTTWNAGGCCGPAKMKGIDDVGFLSKLIARLTGAGLADPARVYATGFSNGAGMAYRLACEKPGEVAAIAVVSAALVMKCAPDRPVSVLVFHGTADRTVPYEGGGRRDFDDARPFPPVSYAVDFWRRADRLPALRTTTLRRAATTCRSTGEAGDGPEVALCSIERGGHSWPAEAGTLIWDFFRRHPRHD